jgi:hypothetical protein
MNKIRHPISGNIKHFSLLKKQGDNTTRRRKVNFRNFCSSSLLFKGGKESEKKKSSTNC